MAEPLSPELRAETLAAVEACGGNRSAAARMLGIPSSTLRTRMLTIAARTVRQGRLSATDGQGEEADTPATVVPSTSAQLGKVGELLERSGIDPDDLSRVDRVNLWQGFSKGEDGEPQLVDLVGIQAKPQQSDGPAWPVVQPGPPVVIKPAEVRHRARSGWGRALVLPDVQMGYWRGPEDKLIPMHDEAALDVVLQVVRDLQPDAIILVGDNLDFPELGRFMQTPGFARTTQAAIDRRTLFAAQLRASAGERCQIVEIEGNHEKRLPMYLLTNAMATFGLKRGGEKPDSWPVMTVPYLCRYEESGVEYLAGYPAAEFWLNEGLRFVHGSKVRSGGSTAHAYLRDARHSTAFGHVHRIERAHVTRHTRHDGQSVARTVGSYCFGCLCRIDGHVPSSKSGIDADGLPVGETEDWQQGFGLVEYEIGGTLHSVEQFEIWNGWTRFRGQEYAAGVDVNGDKVA